MNRAMLKEKAKASIGKATPNPAIITLVYFGISYAIQFFHSLWFQIQKERMVNGISELSVLYLILTLVIVLVFSIFGYGYMAYCYGVSKDESVGYKNLFDGFYQSGKVILLGLLIGIFTMLWSLLFLIPGIIATYRYRMAYFYLIENPDSSALDALRASKEMMKGKKMDLFVLDLSFIGWAILCGLTLGILSIWKVPYFNVTYANFYQEVSNKNLD